MTTGNTSTVKSELETLLNQIRAKGVRLWHEAGQLRFTAPKGLLSHHELEQLRARKSQIISVLTEPANDKPLPDSALSRARSTCLAPLAYTQKADWHFVEAGELRRMRQVASAIRIAGPLRIEAMAASVTELVSRHTSLRIRTHHHNGTLAQEIDEPGSLGLEFHDLSGSPHDDPIARLIETTILAPLEEVESAPCAVRLARRTPKEHVLIVAMDHMVSDAYSMNIFLQELFAIYRQMAGGERVSLPVISLQFSDYAREQEATREDWERAHLPYWRQRLTGVSRLKFTKAADRPRHAATGWADVPIRISRETKQALLEWSRGMKTTLVLSVFTAFVASVMRWGSCSDTVVQFQTDGRADRRITHTIGYFASVLHLRIALTDTDSFVDLLRAVTQEYCRAYEHADSSYLSAQVPRPDLTRSTMFNWVPESDPTGAAHFNLGSSDLHAEIYAFRNPALEHFGFDRDPVVQLFEGASEVTGSVFFPMLAFSQPEMERFARHFRTVLDRMITRPQQIVSVIQVV